MGFMRDRLTTLLYKLMMDHGVAPSVLENIMKTVEKEGFKPIYDHGDLAKYAEKLAFRLVPPQKRNTEAAREKRWEDTCTEERPNKNAKRHHFTGGPDGSCKWCDLSVL